MSIQKLVDLHSLVKPKHKAFISKVAKARSTKAKKVSNGEVIREIFDKAMATHTK